MSLLAAGLLASAGATTATAQPQPPGAATVGADARLADGRTVNSPAAVQEVDRYWTPERMRRAIKTPDVPASAATRKAIESMGPTGHPGSTASHGPKGAQGGLALADPVTSPTVGKVFYKNPTDGHDYECSASSLWSDSHQLVITAGHCIHQGKGGTWMRNWTFIPQYENGNRPYGNFDAKQFRTFGGWMNNSDNSRDVGMVTVWPNVRGKLADVVGDDGLNYNYPRNVDVTVWGYPSNHDNGLYAWWCRGKTRWVGIFDPRIQLMCGFESGASGGPWLMNYNNTTRLGQVNGITSTLATDHWNRSPYFDSSVKAMYDAQGGVT
ncbi:trypsin-like serine peptidase [Streptomyces violascens]|uniref:trypsin-like serine peptidase n=1 Tax=Streptomyces violascens TaxID=67381 RepID=UPI0036D1AA03